MRFTPVILFFFLYACGKEVRISGVSEINGSTFTKNVRIDGHELDSLIIQDCVFNGGSLSLGNVNHVTIRNCIFQNIDNNALKVGFIGPCSDILIENCHFENIGFNGIDSHEDALDCTIRNCSFKQIALSETGAAMAQPHHGIYWKGKNVRIEGNTFNAKDQPFGNGISVRSSGIIRNNVIINAPKNGIMYYSNHPGGDSLIIENNFLINNNYSISIATLGQEEWHNKHIIIRFNSSIQSSNYSYYIAKGFENTTSFEIYGNLIINTSGEYYKTFFDLPETYQNLELTSFDGFLSQDTDLHLTGDNAAIDFCMGLDSYPTEDIDGDIRSGSTLNAGADE
mgnify:CR=1 FL=1